MAEEEYKELFVAEALEIIESLNQTITELENNPGNASKIDAIFRLIHTLKGNAMGMGYNNIGELSHVVEDIFGEVKKNSALLDEELIQSIFKSIDKLSEMVDALSSGATVSYKGLRTKLTVKLSNIRAEIADENETVNSESVEADSANEAEMAAESLIEETEEIQEAEEVEESEEVQETEEIELNEARVDVADQTAKSKINFSETIQVPTRKADDLLNLIGELLIERDSVVAAFSESRGRNNGFDRLNRIVSDLQYGIMDIRLVSVGFLFNKFSRIVRDVAKIESKEVELVLEGTDIEIDRNILKTISDAMIHLVRNSVSHGIETADQREKTGKNGTGKLTLSAKIDNDTVVIEVTDDGGGIDPDQILRKAISKGMVDEETAKSLTKDDILMFIFEPGFSNAEVVNEVSGRGVGMDVVRRSVESIGGNIEITTELGKGTTIALYLPSSLAVKGALLFEMNAQEYAIAINHTEAVVSLPPSKISRLPNGFVFQYLNEPTTLVFLDQFFEAKHGSASKSRLAEAQNSEKLDVIVVRYQNRLIGLAVDKLLLQQEIVEKHLKGAMGSHNFFKSATILGNGKVCLILDIPSVFRLIQDRNKHLRKVA